MTEQFNEPCPTCTLCGEPMPKGEEMFKYHGYSGPCPKPPKQQSVQPVPVIPDCIKDTVRADACLAACTGIDTKDLKAGKLAALQAENERLRAIVERLPATKDGVRVVPGDEVFTTRDQWDSPGCIIIQAPNQENEWLLQFWEEHHKDEMPEFVAFASYSEPDVGYSDYFIEPVSECYSTPDAAREAMEGKA